MKKNIMLMFMLFSLGVIASDQKSPSSWYSSLNPLNYFRSGEGLKESSPKTEEEAEDFNGGWLSDSEDENYSDSDSEDDSEDENENENGSTSTPSSFRLKMNAPSGNFMSELRMSKIRQQIGSLEAQLRGLNKKRDNFLNLSSHAQKYLVVREFRNAKEIPSVDNYIKSLESSINEIEQKLRDLNQKEEELRDLLESLNVQNNIDDDSQAMIYDEDLSGDESDAPPVPPRGIRRQAVTEENFGEE